MNPKKYVVITTINPPTLAIRRFSALRDHQLIVVGDRKTPDLWMNPNTEYLSPKAPVESVRRFSDLLPWNHYCRKMLGYLRAIECDAEIIIDTDDDNIPKSAYRFPAFDGQYDSIRMSSGFVNIYTFFTKQMIWPRGLPLKEVLRTERRKPKRGQKRIAKIGIWQGLADDDPDVDAIYRLVYGKPCRFDQRAPIVLPRGSFCPFNSQNTAFRREAFALLYLPITVSFRFTDILRGLVAQPILWASGYQLGFVSANVVQKRNQHDYLKDFAQEIPCYLLVEEVARIANSVTIEGRSMEDNLATVYTELGRAKIVKQQELESLRAWLRCVKTARSEGSSGSSLLSVDKRSFKDRRR